MNCPVYFVYINNKNILDLSKGVDNISDLSENRNDNITRSNIKLKSANKRKNFKLENEKEYQDIIKENKIQRLIDINGNI